MPVSPVQRLFFCPKLSAAALVHLRSRHDSEPSAPGCWNDSVAQLYTLVSHQPGLGLRQLSAGHGAICWGYKGAMSVAPMCTTCHHLGLTSALVEATVADSVVHVASAPPILRRPRRGGLPVRVPLSCLFSRRHGTVQPVPGTADLQRELAATGGHGQHARTASVWMGVHPAGSAPTLSEECGGFCHGRCTRAKARLPTGGRANFVLYKVGNRQGLRRSFAGQPDLGSHPLSL